MGFLSGIFGGGGGGGSPITAAALVAPQLIGGIMQNSAAKQMAQDQMEFQERLSNTSYQRQMADLQAAGLNPILAAKLGGASTPSGASAPVENVVGPAINSALTLRMQNLNAENLVEQNALIRANTAKTAAETATTLATLPGKGAQSSLLDIVQGFLGKSAQGWINAIDNIQEGKSPLSPRMPIGADKSSAKSIVSIPVAPSGYSLKDNRAWIPSGILQPPKY